jgi:hypothetical protein
MWRERDNTAAVRALGLIACVAAITSAGCAPDGPTDGIPTHPTDTYSVSLEWDAPTTDALGRPLQDLAGYRLYYRASDATDFEPPVEAGAATSATVDGLAAGDYLFAVTAVDSEGNESDLSEPLPVEVGP